LAPAITSVGTTVELRAIQKAPFDATQSIESYQPDISGVVGLVSISIRTDDADHPYYYFQADRKGLEILIATLQAAGRDLDSLAQTVTYRA
jgi:hypothetical protein